MENPNRWRVNDTVECNFADKTEHKAAETDDDLNSYRTFKIIKLILMLGAHSSRQETYLEGSLLAKKLKTNFCLS